MWKKPLIMISSLLSIPAYAFAQETDASLGEARELGHHWDVPAYSQEMRFQIGMMLAISIVILIWPILNRWWHGGGKHQ